MTANAAFKPLSKRDVADVLGVCLRTIENWVNEGDLPAPVRLGNRCYWHPAAFYAWLERRLMAGPASPAAEGGAVSEPSRADEQQTSVPEASAPEATMPKVRSTVRLQSIERMRAKVAANLAALMPAMS